MAIKPHMLVAAYLSLLAERRARDGVITLPGIFATMEEVTRRANELFPDMRKPATEKTVRRHLLGETATGCDVLFERGLAGVFTQYVRLIHPNALYDATVLYQTVQSATEALAAAGSTVPERLVQEYFDALLTLPVPAQQADPSITPRVAVWIAAATLAYDEYLRAGATNESAYQLRQVAINRLAKSFYQVNGYGSASAGFTTNVAVMGEKNSHHQYSPSRTSLAVRFLLCRKALSGSAPVGLFALKASLLRNAAS